MSCCAQACTCEDLCLWKIHDVWSQSCCRSSNAILQWETQVSCTVAGTWIFMSNNKRKCPSWWGQGCAEITPQPFRGMSFHVRQKPKCQKCQNKLTAPPLYLLSSASIQSLLDIWTQHAPQNSTERWLGFCLPVRHPPRDTAGYTSSQARRRNSRVPAEVSEPAHISPAGW